jgi:hypothetical protein
MSSAQFPPPLALKDWVWGETEAAVGSLWKGDGEEGRRGRSNEGGTERREEERVIQEGGKERDEEERRERGDCGE